MKRAFLKDLKIEGRSLCVSNGAIMSALYALAHAQASAFLVFSQKSLANFV